MTQSLNQSLAKGLRVLEALFADGFQAKTAADVAGRVGLPHTTTWRLLKTLEAAGWVVEVPGVNGGELRWEVSADPLARIAFQYQERALTQVQALKRQYHDITGQELNA